jgi:hypothetical protein
MKFLKRWLGNIAREEWNRATQSKESERVNKLHDMFSNNMAAMVAFRIDNGYVVRTMNPEDVYVGARTPGFVYCADHQAIADHLVSSAMRDKLGVQSDMFEKEKQAAQPVYSPHKTRALVGAAQSSYQP